MGKADLHIHTVHSDGMGTVPAVLESARRTGLDVIAITDHDKVRGALEARDLAHKYGIEVVPGTEITTAEGHLVALFVEKPVPAGLSLRETVLRVADEGGLCIAVHPEARWIGSLSGACIRRALADSRVAATLVGVEVYNAGLPQLSNNRRGQAIGDHLGLSQLANSDSHLLWTIGICASEFPGKSPAALRYALQHRLMSPIIHDRPLNYFFSWAKGWLLRQAGLAYWAAEPGSDVVLRRLSNVQS